MRQVSIAGAPGRAAARLRRQVRAKALRHARAQECRVHAAPRRRPARSAPALGIALSSGCWVQLLAAVAVAVMHSTGVEPALAHAQGWGPCHNEHKLLWCKAQALSHVGSQVRPCSSTRPLHPSTHDDLSPSVQRPQPLIMSPGTVAHEGSTSQQRIHWLPRRQRGHRRTLCNKQARQRQQPPGGGQRGSDGQEGRRTCTRSTTSP